MEGKQEVREIKPMKNQDTILECIDGLAVYDNMIVALHQSADIRLDIIGQDAAKVKALKERIEKHCPHAYDVVPMTKDGQEKLVILFEKPDESNSINVMSLDCDDVENINIDDKFTPLAISIDNKNNIVFTDGALPKAIRKITGHEIETLFTNHENEVLQYPWCVATNINGDVIVSDAEKRSLFIFNEYGELTNTYKDFTPGDWPNSGGVCTCPEGWIYVIDMNGDCIHRLEITGIFKDYIVTKEDGLKEPLSLQWYKNMLVVGQRNGQIKYFEI